MTRTQRVHHFLLLAIPVLLLALLLPFMLTFDSVMYFVTRPTCLNCGSLGEYVRTSSLSVGVIGAMVSQLGAQYGLSVRDFFMKMGWHLPSSVGKKDDEKADYQLKDAHHG
ncbi:hypothetical protein KBC70_03670 [Candidatus Woesebacteria bacterium]|nr:hypothetical protein [Candidatus Woesebacteria bacterium]